MNPAHNRRIATDQFCKDVEELLTQEYHRPPNMARKGIDDYQNRVKGHNLKEVVFNQGEEQVARVIDGLIEHGFPTQGAP